MNQIKHGEVWIADLNPRQGTEPGKVRPVLVIQSQILLDVAHPSTLVIPLTTKLINDAEPLRLRITAQDKLKQDSDLLIDQIRAIDNNRLIQGPLLKCDKTFMGKVYMAITEVMNLPNSYIYPSNSFQIHEDPALYETYGIDDIPESL